MALHIFNKNLYVVFEEPGRAYKGSRFDWNGQITQITLNDQCTFCTSESVNDDVGVSGGRGLFGEFGIDEPIGYDDCAQGDRFPKIGVGNLTKDTLNPYFFNRPYPVQPAKFMVKQSKANAISFICEPEVTNGYGYCYEKRFEVDGSSLLMTYNLRNTGTKVFNTNEYCHNFIAINHLPIDKLYRLIFSNPIRIDAITEIVNPNHVVLFHGAKVTWNDIPGSDFFFRELTGTQKPITGWSIEHTGIGVGISENVDFIPVRVNLWGRGHVISPELYYPISLIAGNSTHWHRQYTFYNLLSGSN